MAKLGSWSLNLATGEMTWSAEMCRVLEVEDDSGPRTRAQFLEFLHPDDRISFALTLARSVEDRKDGVTEIRLLLRSGVQKVADQHWHIDFDDAGNAIRVIGTCQDVTARSRIESELRQQRAQLALAGRLGKIGAWRFDISSPVVWWADEVCAIHEVPLGTAPTLDEAIEFYLPHCRESIRVACQRCIEQGLPFDLELEIETGKGQHRWVRAIGEAARDVLNRTQAIQGAFQDITDGKQHEMARREAELASSAKSTFLATMSHEIRTPMNGVIGLVDLLSRTRLLPDQVEIVDLLNASATSLLNIIDNILDFSKIEAGRMQLEARPFPLGDEVEKVCAILHPSAAIKDVELYVFVDPAMPALLMGDEVRVRQVLVNLIGNAIKFSSGRGKSGQVSVRANCAQNSAQTVRVCLEVSDNGVGMDAETVGRLFTAFDQADVSTTRRFGGTGLGLAITHSLVAMMGGQIEVRSVPAVGSVFQVCLTLECCAQVTDTESESHPLRGITCEIAGRPGSLAADLTSYLSSAGATLESSPANSAHPHVVVILPGQSVPAVMKARESQDPPATGRTRFVALGIGKPVSPESGDEGCVEMDVRAMSRANLYRAVAMAAGQGLKSPESRRAEKFRPQRAGVILVADDNAMNREVVARQLRLLTYAADFASDGKQAFDLWRLHDYAALLTDLRMPEMDGYALTAAIRAEEKPGERLPIIALTANALPEEATRCRAAGMDDYLLKPLLLKSLRKALEKWVHVADDSKPCAPAPADLAVLRSMIGDDEAAIAGMLETYRSGSRLLRLELKRSAIHGDGPGAASAAHRLKSNAYAIGARELGDLCARIEQAEAAPGTTDLNDLVQAMEAEAAKVDAYLNSSSPAGAKGLAP